MSIRNLQKKMIRMLVKVCLTTLKLVSFFRTSHEYNVLDYIWSNIDNHVPSDYVWTPSTSRIPIGDAKFSLKAVAVSVDLQRFE